ncbi:TetR/AcrR family transcriptional regulator [Gorillibacterium sp. CAU 1737]|uniref:TetR/AcrR family transcriptional regulator n=1 Tax=Gorillibacterium sp. CAU 1737 TaxID=3140362 RepID=UPI00326154E5
MTANRDDHVYLTLLTLFESKGTRFTTEDLARELATSKRTIYTHFTGKEDMIDQTIDYVFADMMKADEEILQNPNLPIAEKLKKILCGAPDAYSIGSITRHAVDLRRHYPDLWAKVERNLDSLWNPLIQLVEEGVQAGELREVNPVILRLMVKETLNRLLDYEYMTKNQITFESGIQAMGDILLLGLLKPTSSRKN